MPEKFVKSDGTVTKDPKEYIDSWEDLAQPFCDKFGFKAEWGYWGEQKDLPHHILLTPKQ